MEREIDGEDGALFLGGVGDHESLLQAFGCVEVPLGEVSPRQLDAIGLGEQGGDIRRTKVGGTAPAFDRQSEFPSRIVAPLRFQSDARRAEGYGEPIAGRLCIGMGPLRLSDSYGSRQNGPGLLHRIVEESIAIVDHIAGRDRDALFEDRTASAAVLHELTVIDEAASRITAGLRERHTEVPWSEIVGFRNVVIHRYFGLSWPII